MGSNTELVDYNLLNEIFEDIGNSPTGCVNGDFSIGKFADSHSSLCIRTIAGHLYSQGFTSLGYNEFR